MTDTTSDNQIEFAWLGRSGKFKSDGTAYVELRQGFWPKLYKVVGIFPDGRFKLQDIKEDSRDTSRSGNGRAEYEDLEFGLYYATGLIAAGYEKVSTYVIFGEDDFGSLHRDDAFDYAAEMFPGDFAAYEHAQKAEAVAEKRTKDVLQAISEERAAFEDIVIDGISAHPEFVSVSRDTIKQEIKRGEDDESLIQRHIIPSHYVVCEPVFAKATTAEEAVAKAKKLHESREAERQAAIAASADLGLPELTGTPRQIAWAIKIRADIAKQDPKLTALKTATTTRYWIEKYGKRH